MAWEVNSEENQKIVHSVRNGQREEHRFEADKPLKDAVQAVANRLGLGSVIVRADGRDISQQDGDQPLSSFGTIEIMPKMAGA